MNLKDLRISADDVRFSDLKAHYARDYERLGYNGSAIFSQIGFQPKGFADIAIGGRQLSVETFNLLDFDFCSDVANLVDVDVEELGREITDIVYRYFPFEAFRQTSPFPIGFLKEVTIRAKLHRLTPVRDISERNESELMRLTDGPILWNTNLLQSSVHADDIKSERCHYRLACAFVHPTYGFIDFDGEEAKALSEEWAGHLATRAAGADQ